MSELSPIALFTYIRIDTLKLTLKYLQKNNISKSSVLYIFSDNYKSEIDRKKVEEVRKFLKKLKGFKKIHIVKRKKNFGLSNNITSGVDFVLKKYDKIIVLEDDIIVSSNFLYFMNKALNKFKYNKKVWHINAWNYDFENLDTFTNTYFTRLMNCWGWATWKDRWKNYNKNPNKIIKNFSSQEIFKFNMNNSYDYWSQILRNKSGKINTWAVFWYANIFKKNGLCLSPTISQAKNIGYDDLSENQPSEQNSIHNINKKFFIKNKINFIFPNDIKENLFFFEKIIAKNNFNKKSSFLKGFLIKSINYLSFKSFFTANFFSKYFLLSNYESNSFNSFKVESLKNQKKINHINSPSFKLLFETILNFKKEYGNMPKKILDIGGGVGENIILLKKEYKINLNCTIFENKKLVEILKRNHFKHCKFLYQEKDVLKEGKFDIIFCSASLEYINEPYKLLQKVTKIADKLIVIGRMNTEKASNYKIQLSTFRQNVPFIENLPPNRDKFVFYPYKNLSLKKISSILTGFNVLNKKFDDNYKLNIIFKKK